MRKLLKPKDILMLGLANFLDVYQEIRDPFEILSKSYKNMYGFTPERFKRKNYAHLVWRNIKTGNIEKVVKNGEVCLRLTSKGSDNVKRDFPLFLMQKKKWDQKWRFVFFDIQEVNKRKRERLREKLKELGFGMLQKSVFITPHDFMRDMVEFLESFGLNDYAFAVEVDNNNVFTGNIKGLVNKIWNLDTLNEKYQLIAKKLENIVLTTSSDRPKELNGYGFNLGGKNIVKKSKKSRMEKDDDGVMNIEDIYQEYSRILLRDPFLPKELLPDDWGGYKTLKLIKKIARLTSHSFRRTQE